MTSSFNIEGFTKTITEALISTKDGVWFDYYFKLFNHLDTKSKIRLIKKINKKRLKNNYPEIILI